MKCLCVCVQILPFLSHECKLKFEHVSDTDLADLSQESHPKERLVIVNCKAVESQNYQLIVQGISCSVQLYHFFLSYAE